MDTPQCRPMAYGCVGYIVVYSVTVLQNAACVWGTEIPKRVQQTLMYKHAWSTTHKKLAAIKVLVCTERNMLKTC
jgi:hypothetical protein